VSWPLNTARRVQAKVWCADKMAGVTREHLEEPVLMFGYATFPYYQLLLILT
jgi:hypothetical protein